VREVQPQPLVGRLDDPGLDRLGTRRLGPADRVTAVRATLAVLVAVVAVVSLGEPMSAWWVVPPASLALGLDAVDGQVARRTGTVSGFGARFDMETDAFLLAALSVYVAPEVGLWVLVIGAARYLFVLAQRTVPRLRGQAPPRPWCKVVAATQGITLVVAACPLLPGWADRALLAAALALLAESFGREAWQLWGQGGGDA
jgi:phosphatidylglycerophosphate synthase